MKDPIKTIGTKLEHEEPRDAIHIAIVAMKAGEQFLRPGMPVRLMAGTTNTVIAGHQVSDDTCIGVIDPFLDDYPNQYEDWVWVFLKPGSAVDMRHHYVVPALDNQAKPTSESERWLRDFANKWNFNYEEMISEATAQIKEHASGKCPDWHYITARGIDLHSRSELGEDEERFWYHMSQLTGLVASPEDRESFGWSCTC